MSKLIKSFILFFVVSNNAFAQELPDFPFVKASAEAMIEVTPDTAKIKFKVLTFDPSADVAFRALNQVTANTTKFLFEHGVKQEHISAFNIVKRIKRARDNRSYQTTDILGYDVEQTFDVNLMSLSQYDVIIEKLLSNENIEHISSQFDVYDRQALESQLFKQAGLKAKQKAQQMAESLSTTLQSVYAISEGNESSFMPKLGLHASAEKVMAMDVANGPNLYIPQSISISKRLNVIYKIAN